MREAKMTNNREDRPQVDTMDTAMEAPTRRGRGMSARSIQLIAAAVNILREICPATVRAVCYRLFAEGLIDSMAKTNTNGVSRLLVFAREQGIVEWDWVVDETRSPERINTWRDLSEFGDVVKNAYRKDYWQAQARRVEVWSEKGTVRGTLAPVLNEYGVTFRVMHGHGSATAVHAAAEDSRKLDVPLHVLYVGDWDPSGMHMSEVDLPERLQRYGGDSILLERIALTEEDTLPDAGVPDFPAQDKVKDPRYRWFLAKYGERCHELDALSPVLLRDRVQESIERDLDMEAWDHAIEVETAEKESMRAVLAAWPSISMPANK